jgi:hypothetical protein
VFAVSCLVLLVAVAVFTDPASSVTPERARLAASSTAGQHAFRSFSTDAAFAAGTNEGTRASAGALRITKPLGNWRTAGRTWAWSRWTSAWVHPGRPFTQLIPSWNVVTPQDTAVLVQARIHTASGRYGAFKTVAIWATRDGQFQRTSGGPQSGPLVRLDTDTLKAPSGVSWDAYQLRVLPLRTPGTTATPVINSLNAVASRPATAVQPTSHPLYGAQELAVPRYSQMTHRGQYPKYGGGGEAWCSPTSLSMILGYYKKLPTRANYAWVDKSYADPWVDHSARVVYDYGYEGTGNWPFNTAYAANLVGDAFVTRLASLRGAERFIHAGIPLAASISFSRGGLNGAPISATAGHLVVITGFTSTGNVIVNDPAAPSNSSVRRVYDRGQFERAWQTRSAGAVYVVRDGAHPLPARAGSTAW